MVKNYTDIHLDPGKRTILRPHKDNFDDTTNIQNILAELKLTEEEYYGALSISKEPDFQIHLKQKNNTCFINNVFVDGLQA